MNQGDLTGSDRIHSMDKVIYQGVVGAFSHIVARKYFADDAVFDGRVVHFREIAKALKNAEADYAVLPIENTLAGSIYENYDNLVDFDLYVHGEYTLRIEHHLLGKSGTKIDDIQKVYSHAKALEQCEGFFDTHPAIEEVITYDTAGAAKSVSERAGKHGAAIASAQAASAYELQILQKNIEDDPQNWTRFFIAATKPHAPTTANKCSLIFSVSHKPGSLFEALKVFADNNLNMSKIESRPIKGKPFEYYFYVDLEFEKDQYENAKLALVQLKNHTHYFKNLGFYIKCEIK